MSEGGKTFRQGPYDKGKGAKAGRDALPPITEEQILLEPWEEPEEETDLNDTQKATIKWCRIINLLSAMIAKLLDNKRLEVEIMNANMSTLHQALDQLERVWKEAEQSGHIQCEGFSHIIFQLKRGALTLNKKFMDINGPQNTTSTSAAAAAS